MREKFSHPPRRFLLETTLPGGGISRSFERPQEVISAFAPEDLPTAFAAMEAARAKGLYLAGFLSYEAGYALEPKLKGYLRAETQVPLLWFVAYEKACPMTPAEAHELFAAPKVAELSPLEPEIPEATYRKKIEQVMDFIRAGDIYQANFTFRTHSVLKGAPADLYARLRHAQPVDYSALIESEDWSILSLSPELFFEVNNGKMTSRPMKGTAPRALIPSHDAAARTALQADPKQRAENLMILDLIRNDLARVSEAGSVHVPERFSIETYRTVHQMTSTVTAKLNAGASLQEIFHALFPCGSVTGAPKIRAMEILADLESSQRGLYTGALGFIDPNGRMAFNVAIRTLFLTREDEHHWHVEAGVGGGIVADSTPDGEWAECQTKLSYLNLAREPEDFQLLETLRWSREKGIDLLGRHIDRLTTSADYFAFSFDAQALEQQLKEAVENLPEKEVMLRVLLSRNGKIKIEQKPLDTSDDKVWTFALAAEPVSSTDPFLYHKTSRRQVYDRAMSTAKAQTPCDEVLLYNEQGFLTEGSRTNLFLEIKGQLFTPPLEHGLLDGTLRRELIESGKAQEKALTLIDLERADAIYFGNSVRGLIRAEQGETFSKDAPRERKTSPSHR